MRALAVLETLAGMRQPASLAAVAARSDLSESQTFRVLRALETESFVEHLGRSGYRIGSRAVALGTLIGPRPVLVRTVQPLLARLAVITGEAVVLHLRTGDSRVLVLGLPAPSGPIRDPAGVLGERSPLTTGASGRVILAHLPRAEDSELAAIRERGYAISLGENHPGINGISGPLLTESGDPLGSVTIAGPAERLTPTDLHRLAPALLAACRDLSPLIASMLGPDPGLVVDALDL